MTPTTERCIPLDAPAEWHEALRDIPHAFAHTWEHCRAMQLTTAYRTYLYSFESAGVRIACPIAERPFGEDIDIVTPYGFSGFVGTGDCAEFTACWRAFVERKNYVCGYIQLNPLWDNRSYYNQSDAHSYNTVFVIDLRDSLEAVAARFEKRRRRQVREAEAVSDELILDREPLREFLLDTYAEFFARRGAAGAYAFSRDTIARLCDSESAVLVGAGHGGVQAASLLAWTPYVGDALFQVSIPGGEHYAIALVWHRMKYLKTLGVPFLNLGGGVADNDSIAQFKERFGAIRRPLRCLKQVYDREAFERLCRLANVDPDTQTGYFPPYRRR